MNNAVALKIGISGKRHIAPEENTKVYLEIKARISVLLQQRKCKHFIGYSSLAAGADSIFAQVVFNEFRMPLHIILPLALSEYEKDFMPEELKTFRELLAEAEYCEVIKLPPTNGNAKNDAYTKAGQMIIDCCDETIIVWDELLPGGAGGTAEMLGCLAEKNGDYPVRYIKVKPRRQDMLNEKLLKDYHVTNQSAIKARNKHKFAWKGTILLGWATVICFAVKTAFGLEGMAGKLITSFELLFVIIVYVLIFKAKTSNYHGTYLSERMKAETYRLLHVFYHAGVRVKINSLFNGENTELVGVAREIDQRADARPVSKWYAQYVIKSLIHDQGRYHSKRIQSIGNKNRNWERISLIIGISFILNLIFHLIHLLVSSEGIQENLLYRVSIFFNIFLPANYAAIEGLLYYSEWASLKKYSQAAKSRFEEVELLMPEDLDNLDARHCHAKHSDALRSVSGIMLTDNKNWNLLLENKNNYHLIV